MPRPTGATDSAETGHQASRRALLVLSLVALAAGTVSAHDLFMRPDLFFVAPGTSISVKVFSGTFSTSENAITRDRLADLSLVSASGRTALDHTLWTERDPQSTRRTGIEYLPDNRTAPDPGRDRSLRIDEAVHEHQVDPVSRDDAAEARHVAGELRERLLLDAPAGAGA